MKDVQKMKDNRNLQIDRVGIKDFRFPIKIMGKVKEQSTIAKINMYVTLPHYFKGTHMSRFVEVLSKYQNKKIDLKILDNVIEEINKKLKSRFAEITLGFPYFVEKISPISKKKSLLCYECKFICSGNKKKERVLEVNVPVTTLCPCSKEISRNNAHNQRGFVRVRISSSEPLFIEDIIRIVEDEASCEIFSLLKREDEKYVTERAYNNPKFVEDMTRAVVKRLKEDKRINWFSVGTENEESIHNHNVFAYIEGGKKTKCMFLD